MMKNKFNGESYKGYLIYKTNSMEHDTVIYAMNALTVTENPDSYKDIMQEDRYEKMTKYHNRIDKQLLIGNEILFQCGMEELYPHIKEEGRRRVVDQAGKPYIEGAQNIHFNMSHAGNYSLCAFSNQPIGVDIERIKPIDLELAERFFCKDEYEDIVKEKGDGRCRKFFEYWVLKESFIKAVGLGLSIPLNVFRFLNGEDGLLAVQQEINRHKYLCRKLLFCDSNYEVAFCVQEDKI